MKRKNSAAVALSKRQMVAMTPEQRKERARHAVQARWSRKRSGTERLKWYGLFENGDHPKLIEWFHDVDSVERRIKKETRPGRQLLVLADVNYDPTLFRVKHEFQPDNQKQVAALRALLDAEGGERK